MHKSREYSKPSYAWANAALVATVELGRIVFFSRLADGKLAQNIPDDAFYYLQAARNFVRMGRWTFDGVEPSSGFHLLWGYFLATVFYLDPSASLHTLFLIAGVVQSICLALAAYLLTKTAERFAGPEVSGGILLVMLSAASLTQGTSMMESPLVIAAAASILYLLARVDSVVAPATFVAAFVLGIMASLSRSDSGLLVFWLFLAHIYLWRRGISNRPMVFLGASALLGAVLGVVGIMIHTHWISGQWAQASAQEKFFWSQIQGRSTYPVRALFKSFFNPLTNMYDIDGPQSRTSSAIHIASDAIELVMFLVIARGLVATVRSKFRPEAIAFLVVSALTVFSYIFFYRYDSGAIQAWYVGNLEVPAALLTGIGMLWAVARYRKITLLGLATMMVCGVACSFRATAPWQEAMFRAGVYLRSHPSLRPVGAWNAGIIGYVADGGVINLDGLMNDSILPYAKGGTLAAYVSRRNIGYVVDFSNVWMPAMARRGGYGDGSLYSCTENGKDPFPGDPYNSFYGSHLELYRIQRSCVESVHEMP